jgi:hypothetical protein
MKIINESNKDKVTEGIINLSKELGNKRKKGKR